MRVLLDEQLPRQLARHLVGHDVRTVQGFSVLVTGDQNLEHQQNLTTRALDVVVLGAASNALEDILPLVASALAAIDRVQPGQVIRVTG